MENEIWKDIKWYEGFYMASCLGRIKSLNRNVPRGEFFATVKETILKPGDNGKQCCYNNFNKNIKRR